MVEVLKCGCSVRNGRFVLGKGCRERNCGECRMMAKIHPFGRKRIVDLMFKID